MKYRNKLRSLLILFAGSIHAAEAETAPPSPSLAGADSTAVNAADALQKKKDYIAAQSEADQKKAEAEAAQATADQQKSQLSKSSGAPLDNWGLAAAVAVEFYGTSYVSKASINGPDRIVSVDEKGHAQPSFWLVGNWVPLTLAPKLKSGLFLGVKLVGQDGDSQLLDGFAMGVQLSFLLSDEAQSDGMKPSWNVGVGWVEHKVQRLANGISDGQPLPSQYDDVKFTKESSSDVILMVSKDIL